MSVTHGQRNLTIGNRVIGDDQPCFIIAEIGSNHNQDFDQACSLIKAAAQAGVDAVKFQTFRSSSHYSKNTPNIQYLKDVNTYELIKSLELNRSWQADLMDYAKEHGVIFFSSPCDSDAIAGLAALDTPAYKVASFDLTDDDLIFEIASVGKPLILSTGMASWNDIQFALNTAQRAENNQIVLLQCTSLYPAPTQLSNLRALESMRSAFGTLVGYSDHTIGDHIALASVAMGSCMLEKHFTLDRTLPGPDHAFSIEPDEMAQMVNKIREVESAFGDGFKNGPRSEELEMTKKCRRSIHAKIPISCGQTITPEMLVIKRPGLGIPPFLKSHVIGRTAKANIDTDQWITWKML